MRSESCRLRPKDSFKPTPPHVAAQFRRWAHMENFLELVKADWRKTRWKPFLYVYLAVAAAIIYLISSYELWFLAHRLGLFTTVVALFLFAFLVREWASYFHGFAFVGASWIFATAFALDWTHGLDQSSEQRLFFLMAKALSVGYLLGIIGRLVKRRVA